MAEKQEYDFPGYVELVRKYQPGAVIFNDHGPGRALDRQRKRYSALCRVGRHAPRTDPYG